MGHLPGLTLSDISRQIQGATSSAGSAEPGVERRPEHNSVAGVAVPRGVTAAAVTEASDVTDEDLVGAETMPLGQCVGARVIHFPVVACTSSPSTNQNPNDVAPQACRRKT